MRSPTRSNVRFDRKISQKRNNVCDYTTMPLWDVHTTGPVFAAEEKQELAEQITKIYTATPLPAFYVRVRFTEHAPGTTFSGGEPDGSPQGSPDGETVSGETANTGFVHLQVWHLARNFSGSEHKERFLRKVDKVLTPIMEAKGVDWEYTVDESLRDLWKINGVVPPEAGSEGEKEWVRENRVVGRGEKL